MSGEHNVGDIVIARWQWVRGLEPAIIVDKRNSSSYFLYPEHSPLSCRFTYSLILLPSGEKVYSAEGADIIENLSNPKSISGETLS